MRAAIIEDTTKTIIPTLNPFGDDPRAAGWYVGEHCPVNGTSILPFPPRETREECLDDIKEMAA